MSRIISFALVFVVACNTNSGKDNSATANKNDGDKTTTQKSAADVGGCYSWTTPHDTATLHLTIKDNKVTGTLVYDWAEKDRNTGTLQGALQDSLLSAYYTFQSEGATSVRQVIFKIKGDSLVEGFGDVVIDGDTVRYQNTQQLQFPLDRPFVKGACIE